jgi:trans-aconitate methyltransferase
MEATQEDPTQKPATAARMYDYYLGGVHNFPADQEAARKVVAQLPNLPLVARTNRAFLRRAVRELVGLGVRQFLDLGSGIPTSGNVHEIAQELAPDARVAYVDIDPVAVAESLEILDGNPRATAIRMDMRRPAELLRHPGIRLIDFDQPVGLLAMAVLHFVTDDDQAYDLVAELISDLAPGSYLAVSHAAAESFEPTGEQTKAAVDVYRQQTTTSVRPRSRAEIERFFTGAELLEPGLVWLHEWRPDGSAVPAEILAEPSISGGFAGVGRKAS